MPARFALCLLCCLAILLAGAGAAAATTHDDTVPGNDQTAQVAAWALAQLDLPYCWGGIGPLCFDCSGLTSMAYRHAGILIPRVSRDQYAAYAARTVHLRRGDILAFDARGDGVVDHVGIYLGEGEMVDASASRGAVVERSVPWGIYVGHVRPRESYPVS